MPPLFRVTEGTVPECVHEHFTVEGDRPRTTWTCADCSRSVLGRGGYHWPRDRWPEPPLAREPK